MTVETGSGAAERRARVAGTWGLRQGVVLAAAGLPLPIAGTDQFHDFHSHPEHYYLAGVREPGSVLAFDPREGWRLFAAVPSPEDRVWTGDGRSLEELANLSGIERVAPASELDGWLERRRGEPLAIIGNNDITRYPEAYGVHRWRSLELDVDQELSARLSEQVSEARRAKLPDEIAHMRTAARASRLGHLAGLRLCRPGMTERQLQVEIEAEFFRNGAERTAYGSIVGGGPNGAILHFAPTDRAFRDGDLVLVDAGGEVAGYASDVTRTYPVSGRFEGIQADLYDLVLEVQETAIHAVRPGVEYKDLHMAACVQIAAGLVDLGLLRGSPEDLVERDAHALFFPHGLGHMLGLATHDAGGCLAGRERSERFGLKYLRADLPLAENYVVTIEPGIYFIPALLQDAERRETYRDAVDWGMVDRMLDFGGIRIEDDVLVTADGAEVLSGGLPKKRDQVEALRREGLGA